jgi:RNA polymerase sigma-70 factor (ECF subfamily)
MSRLNASPDRPRLRAVPSAGGLRAPKFSDEHLIEAVQRGDESVNGAIYDRLYAVVDHTLFRVFGRRESDHDDLVQAAFEQIILTLSKQSFARACSLKTLASTVASHMGLNALRAKRRERRVYDHGDEIDAECASTSTDPKRETVSRGLLERVRSELDSMSMERAEAVFFHDVSGHKLAEIALMTGVSVAAAQSRLMHGRRELISPRIKSNPETDLTKCDWCGEVACCWYALYEMPYGLCDRHKHGRKKATEFAALGNRKISQLEAEALQAVLIIHKA